MEMAVSETEVSGGENAKSTAPAENPKSSANDKKEKPVTKIVIRRLPPSMSEEAFLEQVSPAPDYDYMYLVKGDMSLGEHAFARVYINLMDAKDVFIFKEKFDNYVFVDGKGHEYPAVVEFAAFQKIPKRRSKFRVDPKCNTIETDPTYLEFLESLKDQPADEEKPEFSYQPSLDSKKDATLTTPLLEYIKQRKMDKQRIRDEKKEEQKKRQIERKRAREEHRRKLKVDIVTSSGKTSSKDLKEPSAKAQTAEVKEKEDIPKSEKYEKVEHKPSTEKSYKKYEDKKTAKVKPKPNTRSEKVYEKKEYRKKDDGKSHKYSERDAKKDGPSEGQKPVVKKVKKYSERREERKIEAQKAEQRKNEASGSEKAAEKSTPVKEKNEGTGEKQKESGDVEPEEKHDEPSGSRIYNSEPSLFQEKLPSSDNCNNMERRKSMDESKSDGLAKENAARKERQSSLSEEMSEDCCDKQEGSGSRRNKENDPRTQRRIRNKDRPTMQIYKPGMLARRRQSDNSEESKN